VDPFFVQFAHDHADVVAIEFHTWWPGSGDPFYQHNIPENTDRTNYYGVNATPWVWVDGIIEPNWVYSYATHNAAYNTRKGVPTSVSLSHAGSYDAGSGAVALTVSASTDAALPAGDYRLHAVLTESDLFWAAPNGIDVHDFIMRDMYPDAGGSSVSFSGGFPQSADAVVSFDAGAYEAANCEVVYFLQNNATKEVLQAAAVSLDALADQTAVGDLPTAARLGLNYPNPFNPKTVIPVSLDRGAELSLRIVDAQGRVLRSLHEGRLQAGAHEFQWDGKDEAGRILSSGVYLAQLRTASRVESRRLLLLK
jgi:hypothetical protein